MGCVWARVYKERFTHSLNIQEFLAHSYPGQPGPRYTVLTGTPPFAATPLSEMYQNIREGRYLEPTHLSPSARSLIARLLAPDPTERPSLDCLLQDDFFSQARIGVPRLGSQGPRAHPDPGLTRAHQLHRALPQSGCLHIPATARPCLPFPQRWAGCSGRWASSC